MSTEAGFKRNTSLMAVGTAISRLTGFARTIALGIALGAASATAFASTYSLANNIPNIVYELVVGGVLSATLVPAFAKQFASDDEDDAWAAVSAVLTATMLAIGLLTVVVLVAAPVLIDLYTFLNKTPTAEAQKETATYFLRLFAPQIAVYGFISVATALLHARRRFAPPMFAPILNNLVVIGVLLAMPIISSDLSLEAMQNDRFGLTFLGLGTTIGVVAMGAVLVPYTRRVSQGRLRFTLNLRHPAVKSVVRMSGWTMGFVIANQVALWVTLLLAGKDNEVGIFAFFIAYQFFILPHGILSVSIMSALQPDLAEKWARNATREFAATMGSGIRLLLLVIAPTAMLFAVLAQPLVDLVFDYGNMNQSSANTIAWMSAMMTIGLPGFSSFLFFTRVLQAMHDARSVFYLYVLQNGINVATAFPLYSEFGLGGLALSQSVAYVIAAIAAFFTIRRRAGHIGGRALVASVIRTSIATAGLVVTAALVRHALSGSFEIIQLVVAGGAGLLVFIALIRVLAPDEFQMLLRLPRRSQAKEPTS